MNNFSPLLKNKKVLILAGFAVVLIIIAIIFSTTISKPEVSTTNLTSPQITTTANNQQLEGSDQNTRQQPIATKISTKNNNAVPTPIQAINEFKIKDWILSDNDVYTFQYPTDWRLERTLFDKGQTVSIVPQNTSDSPYTPNWSITITKTDPTSPITNQEKIYLAGGMRKSITILSDQQAEKLTGVFPPNAVESNAVEETNLYLIRDNYSYVVTYKYPGKKLDQQYEQLFQKITNTVSIEY